MSELEESLLRQMLEEQRRTNSLLSMLVEALGDEGDDPDDQLATYMDGTPVR